MPHAVRDNILLLQYGARINQRGHNGLRCVPAGDIAMGAPPVTRVVKRGCNNRYGQARADVRTVARRVKGMKRDEGGGGKSSVGD